MITANASQRECQKHWNKLHFRVLERNNNKFIWSKLFLVSVFLHVLTWIPTCSELFITFVTVFSLNSTFNDINFEFFIFNEVSPPEDPRMGSKGAPPKVNFSKDCCILVCSYIGPISFCMDQKSQDVSLFNVQMQWALIVGYYPSLHRNLCTFSSAVHFDVSFEGSGDIFILNLFDTT